MLHEDFQKIIGNALDQAGIIAYVDKFGNYLYVNKKWEEATGISGEKAIGQNVDNIIYGSSAMTALRTGRAISGEVFIQTLSGREVPAIMRYQPVFDDERNVTGCFITSVFDSLDEARDFADRLDKIPEGSDHIRSHVRMNGSAKYDVNSLIGESRAMKELREHIYIAGSSDASCLIEGETGTGKELVAHAVHNASRRKRFPFVKVNCSAIPENLMESEFFGYEDGSFTGGAKGGRAGKFEKAHHGSMFLDEINAMPLHMQPKLLRVLQEKEVERIGGVESIPVDVRIIAASNKALDILTDNGQFRSDLYYRLNIITIRIPPLRERREDIYPLAKSFISRYNIEAHGNTHDISDEAVEYLMGYEWPGNVRELQNVIERTMAFTCSEILEAEHLRKFSHIDIKRGVAVSCAGISGAADTDTDRDEDNIFSVGNSEGENAENQDDRDTCGDAIASPGDTGGAEEIIPLREQKSSSEKRAIERALESCGYNKSKTARMLNISRTLLYKKLEKYNISC